MERVIPGKIQPSLTDDSTGESIPISALNVADPAPESARAGYPSPLPSPDLTIPRAREEAMEGL